MLPVFFRAVEDAMTDSIVTYSRGLEGGGVEVLVWTRVRGWLWVPEIRKSDSRGVWWSRTAASGVGMSVDPFGSTDEALAVAREK